MVRKNQLLLNFIEKIVSENDQVQVLYLESGQKLMEQGRLIPACYIIKSGIVKCYISEENGKDYLLEILGAGEIVGELEMLQKSKSLSNVKAISATELYQIDQANFYALTELNKEFNQLLLSILAERLSRTAVRSSYQQVYPLTYNLVRLLQLFSNQELKITKNELSEYLGVSIRSLNRSMKQLRADKIVDEKEMQIIVADDTLQEYLNRFLFAF